ncbi:chromosome partitioning protein [Salinadaptatus halalkaliphilus]|uniref:Chromosome partitioning protein n=1 Tax=Salinadaptatus halalkaliphilus TaxID=2419781 RepID=A0A4S3TNY0_9EURY|nr:P-loop NTPase [Salinadaptatus halalkaliphilus]THE66034.1 chromosome partitioning protein [Salinadaptatus halalkaliphilus]
MIAIAGSKGGCGTSTVTLGLAEAFSRVEAPVLAVDADRQLPNLHVVTDLERTPTLAALENDTDLRTIAQQHPREPLAGVVPAPKPEQAVGFETLASKLDHDGPEVLLDCPSGAGPDVVDPLGQAAGVIVVAGSTERSLAATETTIEMARRLGTPVYGAVLNRCTEIPERALAWDGVPLLGCVPERPSPLVNDEVASAFDDIVTALQNQSPTDRAPPEYAGELLPIGTDELDYRLGGGVPPGSLVAFVADPASQAEQVLYRATGVRGTLYLSSERTRANVRRAIESSTVATAVPTVRRVAGEDALEEALALIDKLPDAANVIVDPIDAFERRDRAAYVSFLEACKERVVETESVAIVHCLTDDPPHRSATLRAADAVFELKTAAGQSSDDTTRVGTGAYSLSIPKYRPGTAVTDGVIIDLDSGPMSAPVQSPLESD